MKRSENRSIPRDSGDPSGRRRAQHALLFGLRPQRRGWWIVGAVLLMVASAALVLFLFTQFDWSGVAAVVARLRPVPLIAAMAVLPLVAFPIAPVYLVAGARFGPVLGGVVVAAVTAVHLLASHLIARTVLRGPIERLLQRRHGHLPDIPVDEQAAVTVIAALVPGLPYVVRNYLLAVAGVRLRIYFWICLPIYVARSYVSIMLGDLSSDPDRMRLLILLGVDGLKVGICAWVIWRLREHHRRYHAAETADASAPPSG